MITKMQLDENELRKAMKLVRDMKKHSLQWKIHPVAMLVAEKFIILCDEHFSKKKLTPEQNAEIDAYARYLFGQMKGELHDLFS